MRITSHPGARRLLVASGALTLGLTALAPTAVWADAPAGKGKGTSVEVQGGEDRGPGMVWVCKYLPSGTNPWVVIQVAEPAARAAGDLVLGEDWSDVPGAQPAVTAELSDAQAAAISIACAALDAGRKAGGGGTQPGPVNPPVGGIPPVDVIPPVVPPTWVPGPGPPSMWSRRWFPWCLWSRRSM